MASGLHKASGTYLALLSHIIQRLSLSLNHILDDSPLCRRKINLRIVLDILDRASPINNVSDSAPLLRGESFLAEAVFTGENINDVFGRSPLSIGEDRHNE